MKRLFLSSTCMAGLAALPQPALAQDTSQPESAVNQPAQINAEVGAPTPGTPPATQAPTGIQDIVITAQRRSENLQRAAIAVSAISGDALKEMSITRPTELTAAIPALQVAPAAGPYNLFYIRGVGNFNANPLSDSALAFNVDGVYIGRPSGSTGFFYDLERVEVVKGPQGTLYGRNATGGAINVITTKPKLNQFGGDASVELGNHGQLRFDGAVNAPLGDRAAIRLAGISVRHKGYMNDGTDDQNDYAGRVSFRVDPTSAIRVNLVADYFHQGGKGPGATPLLAPLGIPNASTFDVDDRIGFFSAEGQAFYTSQRAGTLGRNFYPFPADFKQFQRNHAWGVAGSLDWDTPVGTLTIIPGHRENHINYLSYTPGFQVRETSVTKQNSVEARLATSEERPLRAILGAFHFNERTTSPQEAYASNWNAQYDSDLKATSKSDALFGRLVYAIRPEIRVNAGARQTWEDKSFSGTRVSLTRVCFVPAAFGGCPTAPPLPFGTTPPALGTFPSVLVPGFGPEPFGGFPDVVGNPAVGQFATVINADQQKKFKKFTWRVGADWDITPRNLLFASYETGFKSGGFFFSPLASRSSYRPETISAFTLGSKNRFINNRLQVNAELFYWRYKDQQISHLVTIAGVPTFATENVGKATIKGLELETRFAATQFTTLTADLQYLAAKYNQFNFLQSNTGGATSVTAFNGTGCPTTGFDASASNSFIVDCSGKRPPFSPKWSINLGAQQRVPVSFGEFVADVRTHYQTKTFVGLDYVPVEQQGSYWLADAALTFYAPERKYYAGAFVNNIFDETVKSQIFPTPGTAFYSTTLRPPRTYGIRAGVKF